MGTNNAINLSAQGVAYYDGAGHFSTPTLSLSGLVVGAANNDIATIGVGATGTVLLGNTGGNPSFSNVGIAGTVLIGTASNPTFSSSATLSSLTLITPLTVVNGGTGSTSFSVNSVIISGTTSTSPLSSISLGVGQVLIGTNSFPSANTLTMGSGISITNAAGSITIATVASPSGGIIWTDVTTANTVTLSAGHGYIADLAGTSAVPFLVPATPTLGDTYYITGRSAAGTNTGGWQILTVSNTDLVIGGISSATSAVTSTQQTDSVIMVCTHQGGTASEWTFIDIVGNLRFS
jgi:hypothetical protein